MRSVRDENHATPNTGYAYDPAGRLIEVVQTLSSVPGGSIATRYGYDAHNNLTSVTDPNGNVTSYLYDDFGQMILQQSPVTGTTTYSYDSGGNVVTTIDANGATTTRAYDAAGRLVSATSTGFELPTEVVAYTYDGDPCGAGNGIGRPATMTDPTGETTYCYERRGLLAATTDGAGLATQFFYDADGNRSQIIYPSTRAVTYTHDYASRPLSASANGIPIVTSADYLPFGPLTHLGFGNGTARTMTHDGRYRPSQNVLTGPAGTIASYTYAADAVGNITRIDDDVDAAYNRNFASDDLNRLITANSGSSLWGSGSYTYDAMGNMTSLQLGSLSLSFSYYGTTPKLQAVTGTDPATMTYDAAGNESGSYNARNQLDDGGAYGYDGRGVRVYARKFGWPVPQMLEQHSVYSPELHLLARTDWSYYTMDGIFARTDYLWFGDLPVAQIPAYFLDQPPLYTFTDHLGTPILQTDADAGVVWRAEYEPYGTVYAYRTGDSADQILRLPGQEADELIGEERYYNIFRWYRAGWGRYTQADPAKHTAIYSYALQNPQRFTDPLGLYEIKYNIVKKPHASPVQFCGSPIACTQVSASLDCGCECNPNAGVVFPNVTLNINGVMYVYNGPFGALKKTPKTDKSVKNAATAAQHEYSYHIHPAIMAVDLLITEFESKGFTSASACVLECIAVNWKVTTLFAKTIGDTQAKENQ